MKNYKDYNKIYIGSSDIASLILLGCVPEQEENEKDGALKVNLLHFGSDGDYLAYYVDQDAVIPDHYTKIFSFENWLKIFDDHEKTFDKRGNFEIYRAGSYGVIIKKTN